MENKDDKPQENNVLEEIKQELHIKETNDIKEKPSKFVENDQIFHFKTTNMPTADKEIDSIPDAIDVSVPVKAMEQDVPEDTLDCFFKQKKEDKNNDVLSYLLNNNENKTTNKKDDLEEFYLDDDFDVSKNESKLQIKEDPKKKDEPMDLFADLDDL